MLLFPPPPEMSPCLLGPAALGWPRAAGSVQPGLSQAQGLVQAFGALGPATSLVVSEQPLKCKLRGEVFRVSPAAGSQPSCPDSVVGGTGKTPPPHSCGTESLCPRRWKGPWGAVHALGPCQHLVGILSRRNAAAGPAELSS